MGLARVGEGLAVGVAADAGLQAGAEVPAAVAGVQAFAGAPAAAGVAADAGAPAAAGAPAGGRAQVAAGVQVAARARAAAGALAAVEAQAGAAVVATGAGASGGVHRHAGRTADVERSLGSVGRRRMSGGPCSCCDLACCC